MALLSNLDLIRRVPLFSVLTSAQCESLVGAVGKRHFRRGEKIVEEGKKSDALFILLEGQARVLMTDHKSREVILATLQAGDYVGEMSLIDNEPHSATVEADVECQTLTLGREAFTRCLEQNSSVAFSMMRGLVQRLRSADRKIGSLALLGVYGRVANMLIESANPVGDNQKIIRKKISRQDIAKMVGASREMVSRVMKDFEDSGFIETQEGGSILINERRAMPR
jgi:CRP-like cAMP-binding protein